MLCARVDEVVAELWIPESPEPVLEVGERACWRCGMVTSAQLYRCPDDGTALVNASLGEQDDPIIGQIVDGRYHVGSPIARGGVASVYAARQGADVEVAVKVLRPDLKHLSSVRRRFVDEARLLAGLDHPNIVAVRDFGQLPDGNLFMVMDRLRGESLYDRIYRLPLAYREVFDIVEGLARALAYIHARGVVHRDVKPSNVMLTECGVPKLIDFGVAQGLRAPLQEEGAQEHAVGTPIYMAPEQLRGHVASSAMDVYALGTMLYLMLADRLPFGEGRRAQRRKLGAEGPPPLRTLPGLGDLPPLLDKVVQAMLAREPTLRPSVGKVREVVADVRAVMSPQKLERLPCPAASVVELDAAMEPTRALRRAVAWVRRNPVLVVAATTVTLLGVGVSIL